MVVGGNATYYMDHDIIFKPLINMSTNCNQIYYRKGAKFFG